jgi:hypothetical protein
MSMRDLQQLTNAMKRDQISCHARSVCPGIGQRREYFPGFIGTKNHSASPPGFIPVRESPL